MNQMQCQEIVGRGDHIAMGLKMSSVQDGEQQTKAEVKLHRKQVRLSQLQIRIAYYKFTFTQAMKALGILPLALTENTEETIAKLQKTLFSKIFNDGKGKRSWQAASQTHIST